MERPYGLLETSHVLFEGWLFLALESVVTIKSVQRVACGEISYLYDLIYLILLCVFTHGEESSLVGHIGSIVTVANSENPFGVVGPSPPLL